MRPGFLYLMLHFPFFWWCKIGITGKTAGRRARQIDRAVLGFPIPVMVVYLPAVRMFETAFHRFFSPLSSRFYRGDGSTEWFWLPAAIPVFLFGVGYWYGIFWILNNL